jgi:hypothetical protein
MGAPVGPPDLPPFQQQVARMFFALPASRGFLLAGGSGAGRAAPYGAPHRGP